jgi:two-component system cell cycle sensor histidine kinase/response regulator CckA
MRLRVLLVEDNPGDADLIRELLPRSGAMPFEVMHVSRLEAAVELVAAEQFDIALLDLGLPDSTGLNTVRTWQRQVPNLPVVVLTGNDDERMGLAAIQEGAQDYVVKGQVSGAFLSRVLVFAHERHQNSERLRESEARARLGRDVLHRLNYPGGSTDAVHDILQIIKAGSGVEAVGIRLKEGDDFPYYETNGFPTLECMCGHILRGCTDPTLPYFTEGASFWTNCSTVLLASTTAEDSLVPRRNRCMAEGYESVALVPLRSGTEIIGLLQLNDHRRDRFTKEMISFFEGLGASIGIAIARKRSAEALRDSEEQLRQAQKMEAIGQLAGGIAHDFNNLLTAIIGYSDLILAPGPHEIEGLLADVAEIKAAAERAGSLTRQILAFSRRQTLKPEVVSLNEVVAGTERLLGRTLGEDVNLLTLLRPESGLVEVDVSQIEQVLMNLALNARDSMPDGGRLTIETANVELSEEYCRSHLETFPGPHVMLAVSDTGIGMDDETKSRAFEPFFTTKEPGKGTGLGLSTVYGTVNQSGGSVHVYSEVGKGTTIRIYLPRVDQPKTEHASIPPASSTVRGSETILLVEDEAAVRTLAERILVSLGYQVLEAANGDDALILLRDAPPVDLLLTDVVLPGNMQGNQLADAARVLRPGLAVVYMSGYTRDAIVHAGRIDAGVNFLEKPFVPEALATMVRVVLDQASASK